MGPARPPDSIASFATRAQHRRAWNETNGSRECHGSLITAALDTCHYDNHNVFVRNTLQGGVKYRISLQRARAIQMQYSTYGV